MTAALPRPWGFTRLAPSGAGSGYAPHGRRHPPSDQAPRRTAAGYELSAEGPGICPAHPPLNQPISPAATMKHGRCALGRRAPGAQAHWPGAWVTTTRRLPGRSRMEDPPGRRRLDDAQDIVFCMAPRAGLSRIQLRGGRPPVLLGYGSLITPGQRRAFDTSSRPTGRRSAAGRYNQAEAPGRRSPARLSQSGLWNIPVLWRPWSPAVRSTPGTAANAALPCAVRQPSIAAAACWWRAAWPDGPALKPG